MAKQIYICEFCGCISSMFFGQCKHCETHEDGTKYTNTNKVDVPRLSREDIIEIITNLNKFIKKEEISNIKMNNNISDDKLNKLKGQFDIILNNTVSELNSKINKLEKKVEKLSVENDIKPKVVEDDIKITSRLIDSQELTVKNSKLVNQLRKLEEDYQELKKKSITIDEYQLMKIDFDKTKSNFKLLQLKYNNLLEEYDMHKKAKKVEDKPKKETKKKDSILIKGVDVKKKTKK